MSFIYITRNFTLLIGYVVLLKKPKKQSKGKVP